MLSARSPSEPWGQAPVPSPSPQPQSPRGWGHCEEGEGQYLARGDGGSGEGKPSPAWPDPASLLQEQRAALQRLWRPLNYQRDSAAQSSRAAAQVLQSRDGNSSALNNQRIIKQLF